MTDSTIAVRLAERGDVALLLDVLPQITSRPLDTGIRITDSSATKSSFITDIRSGPKTPGSVPCVNKKRRIKSVSPYEKRSMRRHLTTLDAARR